MSVGRRRIALPFVFLALAILAINASVARAQHGGRSHELWNPTLTKEQMKAALSRLAIGDGDEKDPLHKLLREHMQQKYPELPREFLDAAIKKAISDPKFMEQAKQYAKEKQTDPGRPPKFSQDDLSKLAKIMPPETDPKKLPPGVKLPPEWKGPPDKKIPGGKLPPDVPDPVTPKGDPRNPGGKVNRPPGKVDPGEPTNPPGANTGQPPAPKTADDALFKPPDEPTDPRSKSLQAFASIWERNVGPLDQTPEVKRALFDLVSGNNGLDLDLMDDKGNSVWDLLKNGDGNGFAFGDIMDGSSGNWKLPQFNFPSLKLGKWAGGSSSGSGGSSSSSWKWGSSSSSGPRPGSSSGSSGFGNFSFGGSWFPLIVLGIVLLGILLWVVLKKLREGTPELAYVADGLGPWPIDPRLINTREDVVKAFEYLSVLICGPSAKTWTHNTIADALADLAATHGETAVMLARLYELARYAPLDEPLTRDELMESRELVCGLAGVSY